MALIHRDLVSYTLLYAEKLDPSLRTIGDSKESFYFGSLQGVLAQRYPNQWPSEDLDFFEKVGALNDPTEVVRLLRYPGEVISSDVETYGATAHSDYGMVTLLLVDVVPGLQVVVFLDPNPDCDVECLESCCRETCPPRLPAILAGDYIKERFKLTYAT